MRSWHIKEAANLFLLNLQYDRAILEACSAPDNFFLMQLALQAGDIHLYINYIDATMLSITNNPAPSSSNRSLNTSNHSSSNSSFIEDDIFSNTNDDDSIVSITTYYSDSSWGSTGTMVSNNSASSSNTSSDMGDFSDYFFSL